MPETGEIDALHTARKPSACRRGGLVRGLFPDYRVVERRYLRDTGHFPVMHTASIRREVYDANRWIAQSLAKAFAQAQAKTHADLKQTAALKAMLPWANAEVGEAIDLLGEDWWADGFEKNSAVPDTFLRYHHEQAHSKRRLAPQDPFAPETLASFRI